MSATELALRIEFLSDWHVGTGDTLSIDVDAAVARDHEGFPTVPAKTVTGLLRDAAEQLASSLGDGWRPWVRLVFGDQVGESAAGTARPAALSVRPARLRERLRRAIGADPDANDLVRLLSATRSSTAVDERGTARSGSLRTIEVARAGLVLLAPVRLHLDGPSRDTALAMLSACARLTEAIGGGRRRGLGRARVALVQVHDGAETVVEPADWSAALPDPAPAVPIAAAPAPSAPPARSTATTGDGAPPVVVRLDIETLTPVLASPLRRGNESTTLTYLPGTTLLPVVARALSAMGVDVPAAIAAGRLVVRHALPAVAGADGREQRAWPAPAVHTHAKGEPRSEWWSSLSDAVRPRTAPRKAVRAGWVSPDGTGRRSVAVVGRMHNQIDDRTQRTPDHGGLYVYEAIAAGERFVAEVLLAGDCAARAAELCTALTGPAALGRSKKDDYGSVVMTASTGAPGLDAGATGTAPATTAVLCLSDVVIDSPALGTAALPQALAAAVASAAGTAVAEPTSRSIVRSVRIDSWHAGWGVPRPTLVAIAAGSVLEVSPGLPLQPGVRLRIGERTAEGFGDVVVAPDILVRDIPAAPSRPRRAAPAPTDGTLAGDDAELIESLRRRATIDRIQRLAVERLSGSLTDTLLAPVVQGGVPFAWLGGVLDWLRAEHSSPSTAVPVMPPHLARNYPHAAKVRDLLFDATDPWNEFLRAGLADPAAYRLDAAIAILSALRDRAADDTNDGRARA